LTNSDIARIINSNEIQKVLRPKRPLNKHQIVRQKKNPLKNRRLLEKLNPYAKELREAQKKISKTKRTITKEEKKALRKRSNVARKGLKTLAKDLEKSAEENIENYQKIMADARNY